MVQGARNRLSQCKPGSAEKVREHLGVLPKVPGLQSTVYLRQAIYPCSFPKLSESAQLVTGIHCRPDHAWEDMRAVQERFGKTDGVVALHAYQSFREGEVTPEQCHEIGVALARKVWGKRFQVLVATHMNTDNLHNHFVINSVSYVGPKKLADSTYQRDLQDIRRILPTLGNYKLTDLRKEVIRDFYEEMRHTPRLDGRGNLSEKSVEGLHNTLCGILSAAVDEGYLTHNPAWRCYKPKGQKKERPVADEETVKKLITAFEGQSMKYETYFKLVLATGLRRGEACGLKWSDINWRKRTIHVQRGVVKLSHQESITKDPKTTSGDRMVYLSKEMCQLLKAWRKECEWDRQQTANETVNEDDYLFRQPNGKPMNPCTFTYRFKLILKANNLPLNLNVHSLRHTNASLLIAQGVDVRTVASLLGHAQASTTLDIYAHAFDKNKRKAQEKLGKTIGL